MSDTSKREELIEEALVAYWGGEKNTHLLGSAEGMRAAFAVFEQAHTPTDDERTWVTGFLLGCGVAPDRAEEYAGKLLAAGFRRTAVQEPQSEPTDAQAWAAARAVADLRKRETGAPAWFNVDHARAALRATAGIGQEEKR